MLFEIMRFVEYHRPPLIVLENVPALLTNDNGQTFQRILRELRDYSVSYKVLTCSDYGIPQMRKRLFIVGTLGGRRLDLDLPKKPTPTLSDWRRATPWS